MSADAGKDRGLPRAGDHLPVPAAVCPRARDRAFRTGRGLGVHRNTMRLHPASPRTQERMREYNRVFQALAQLEADVADAGFRMKSTPIRVLGGRTLFEAVRLRYLQTISAGQNG